MQAPDSASAVVGWRVWDIVDTDGGVRLRSFRYPTLWPPGKELCAVCRAHEGRVFFRRSQQHAPGIDASCTCGISALHDSVAASEYLRWSLLITSIRCRIVGQVSLWGKVVECESGFRASHAYPGRLYVPIPPWEESRLAPLARALAFSPTRREVEEIGAALSAYGVPVDLVPWRTLVSRSA